MWKHWTTPSKSTSFSPVTQKYYPMAIWPPKKQLLPASDELGSSAKTSRWEQESEISWGFEQKGFSHQQKDKETFFWKVAFHLLFLQNNATVLDIRNSTPIFFPWLLFCWGGVSYQGSLLYVGIPSKTALIRCLWYGYIHDNSWYIIVISYNCNAVKKDFFPLKKKIAPETPGVGVLFFLLFSPWGIFFWRHVQHHRGPPGLI